VEGHLGLVVCALGERTAFAPLHAELTEAGCASLRGLLADAVARAQLPAALDVPAALAALEGPVFYRALVRREPLAAAALPGIVDAVLAAPPVDAGAAVPERGRPEA
jgi:hypothetical protein